MSTSATPLRLSPTARATLEGAAAHPDHRVELPSLPAAVRNGVIRSMLRAGLVEEVATKGRMGLCPRCEPRRSDCRRWASKLQRGH
jgi:hypothetical protein